MRAAANDGHIENRLDDPRAFNGIPPLMGDGGKGDETGPVFGNSFYQVLFRNLVLKIHQLSFMPALFQLRRENPDPVWEMPDIFRSDVMIDE
jgi:hypothetical protein